MLEFWRQDAVYSFDFWPEAVVTAPRELMFTLQGGRVAIRHLRDGEWGIASARDVAEAMERRIAARTSEDLPMTTSGVRHVEGCVGDAWSSTLALRNAGTISHVIGCELGDGLIAMLKLDIRSSSLSDSSIELMEAVARRIERTHNAKLSPEDEELEYILGPLRILAPSTWSLPPTIGASLEGEERHWVNSHELTFEFSNGPNAPPEWLESPSYVDRMLLIDGTLGRGGPAHTTFANGSASANSWAALPPPYDEDPDDVDTESSAVIEWPHGTACRLTAIQEIPYREFNQAHDLAKLRDLVLRVAASSRCSRRTVT